MKNFLRIWLVVLLICCMAFGGTAMAAGSASEDLTGVHDTLDYEELRSYIYGFADEWEAELSEELAEGGILKKDQLFVMNFDVEESLRQMLAITAVRRDYTFYNRIMCERYAEYMFERAYTYEITGKDSQQQAAEALLSCAAAADCLGFGGALGEALRSSAVSLEDEYKVIVTVKCSSLDELLDGDEYDFGNAETEDWHGWTAEKRAECEELVAMEEEEFEVAMAERQDDSLLYSPVPFYKQGAVEWGNNAFGGGTLATDACCPTSIAMVLSYFKGERITPAEVAAAYDSDAYRSAADGAYGAKMCRAAGDDYGVYVDAGTRSLSGSEILTALEGGAKIVMSMKGSGTGGRYAAVSHYVVLAGLTEDGKVIVNNPGVSTNVTYDDIGVILDNQSGRGYGIYYY